MNEVEEAKRSLSAPVEERVDVFPGGFLDYKYTFDNFVVGKSNEYAYASARGVADRPGLTGIYNPLFIAGRSGLGKTHLLKAIGFKIGKSRPGLRIGYYSTPRFTEEVIKAIHDNKRYEFREALLSKCDVLLMDDIQHLSKAEATQDEFFYVFNAFLESGRQVVVTSDQSPAQIKDVHDRIISRFKGGVYADVQPPDLETRIAFLKKKDPRLSDDNAYLIASCVKASIRELEGALNQVTALAAYKGQPISSELVRTVLRPFLQNHERAPSFEDIVSTVAQSYGVKSIDIRGKSRTQHLARARHVAMYLARTLTDLSSPVIAKELGGRDHSTVLYGTEAIAELMKSDEVLDSQIQHIVRKLKGGT
jgi:chromosomal replication initiator protein